MASNSDATHQPLPPFDASTFDSSNVASQRPRHDSSALLMLPAPLSVNRPMMASSSTIGMSRSSEDNYMSDTSGSNQRLIPSQSSQSPEIYSEGYDSSSAQRHLSPASPYDSPTGVPRAYNNVATRRAPSPQSYPGVSDSSNPFRSMTTSPTSYEEGYAMSAGDSDESGLRGPRGGVRLTDSGPVPGPEGVRRVSRQGRRPTSQAPQQNRYSRSSTVFSLPPGAAPPQPYSGGGSGVAM